MSHPVSGTDVSLDFNGGVTPSNSNMSHTPHEASLQPLPPIGFEGHGMGDTSTDISVLSIKTIGNDHSSTDPVPPAPVDASNQSGEQEKPAASLFMNDGRRRVDYVLVYNVDDDEEEENKKHKWRAHFEDQLKKESLELEVETKQFDIIPQLSVSGLLGKLCSSKQHDKDKKIYYVKVHAPWDVLAKYAEATSMKMPLAENDMHKKFESCWSKCPTPFDFDESILPTVPDFFTAPFTRSRTDQFIIQDKETFFTPAQRSLLTYQVLSRAIFEDLGDPAKNKFGITNLLNNGTYDAAFPLHEGEYYSDYSILASGAQNQRHLLYETWAKPGAWYKFQPLDHIRLYFGEKISIYFTWLGYYTGVLIPAGLVGLAVFIYGLARMPFNEASNDICSEKGPGNWTMCPLCDGRCEYWRLKSSCIYSRATYLFDNEATVAFAGFMALWSTAFHELWKRRAAEIEYDWDVADFEEEETIRPEYEASVRRRKPNPVTQRDEPYMSYSSKICRIVSSLWVVLFMLCVVCAAVFGVIVYRMTVSAVLYAVDQATIKQRAGILTSISAALINLVIIILLGKIYELIAKLLTNFETHRTLTEWEDSFTLKMFLFQFVNHFASLFYIAFFKGKLVGRPGAYNRQINASRQEECDPSGCLIELCIQLAIIMLGKQSFNNFKEIILPKLLNWFKSRKVKEAEEKKHEHVSQWEKDFAMSSMPDLGLFDEYLEMVIQYGFVTIFVAAFPLAPLCALLNNIIEIRLDAYKFVTQWRRPLAMKAQDIGIWFGILQGISTVAVMSNAAIIAFTSEFIPKLVYQYSYSENNNLDGYLNFSLSVFNVADFEKDSIPSKYDKAEFGNVTQCRYRDYRSPPDAAKPYESTLEYWHILTARLAFILVFVILVWLLSWLIGYIVPDMPRSVKLQMLREKYLAKEALLKSEEFLVGIKFKGAKPDQDSNGIQNTSQPFY
ncbi:anoctamin-4-like isoform X2 [Physella acuta]|uniref:anoctamin-4-like isoform X2 n=1 Tax=Physella acuta TaxID=109671 RepID=UPI0027DE6D80|nr:anoctamin-4-like isoform X2 [Physella acuta]